MFLQVNEIANSNLEIYSAVETEDTQGHLITFPYTVNEDGKLTLFSLMFDF